MQLITHFQRIVPQNKEHMLYSYACKHTGFLNMQKYGPILIKMLRNSPFFNRFDIPTLNEYLKCGKPEVFGKDDIIYLKDRVGVIFYGSVKILSHSKGILNPYTEVRHHQGRILGHQSDNGISTNSQNWLFSYDEGTEILFFDKETFEKLWYIQIMRTDK